MVLRRIEVGHLVARAAFDDDVAQRFAPLPDGAGMHGVEIQFGNLRKRIHTGVFDADGRQSHGDRERPHVGREGQHGLLVPQQLHVGERLREAGREEYILIGHPPLRATHAGQLVGSRPAEFAQVDLLLGDRMQQIDDHPPGTFARKGIAVYARTGRGGQFDPDIHVGQRHGVVAARSPLVVMRKEIGLQDTLAVVDHDFARGRMKQNVRKVGASRTAQVRMRKAVDRRVAVMVAGAGVPVAGTGVGTQLHHAERRGGARIGMTVESGADERVHIIDGIGGPRRTAKGREGQQQNGKFFGHNSSR